MTCLINLIIIMAAKTSGPAKPPQPWFLQFRSSPSFILLTVCISIFNDIFLFGTVIPALPYALPQRIGVDDDDVQIWIAILLAVYGGALLVGSLVFGWVGDRLTRRHALFLSGLLMLLVATALLAFGRHIAVLVLGRIMQGLSAAAVWTSGLALLTDIFGQERYGEAVGYAQTSLTVGTTSAPLLGGIVYARGGYSAVSAMSLGVVCCSIALALIMVEPKAETGWEEPAPAASLQGSNNQNAASEVSRMGRRKSSPTIIEPDERSRLLQDIHNEGNSANRPAYPLLLGSGRVLAAMGGIFTYSFVIISFEGMIPLFVKETFHWDSTRAALIFLTWIIPGFLGPIAGKASDKLGPQWIAIGGFLFAVPPLIFMRFVTEDNIQNKVLLSGLLTLVGLGLVWILPSCTSDLSAAATALMREHRREFGGMGASTQAFGLFIFAYSCGSIVGPTIVGLIKAKADWGLATSTLAFACTAACIPIMLKTPTSTRRNHSDQTQTLNVRGSIETRA